MATYRCESGAAQIPLPHLGRQALAFYLWASAGEAVAVEVRDAPSQRAPQNLKLLPADDVVRQVFLETKAFMVIKC